MCHFVAARLIKNSHNLIIYRSTIIKCDMHYQKVIFQFTTVISKGDFSIIHNKTSRSGAKVSGPCIISTKKGSPGHSGLLSLRAPICSALRIGIDGQFSLSMQSAINTEGGRQSRLGRQPKSK